MTPSARIATMPFRVSADSQVIAGGSVTTTEERRHGVVRLEDDRLVVQWRVEREVQRIGHEIRTDVEREGMREVTVPVRMLGDARVVERGRWWWRRWELVVTARDLAAFDTLAGDEGFALEHPAKLELPVHRSDLELARELASELELAIAELALADAEGTPALPSERPAVTFLPTPGIPQHESTTPHRLGRRSGPPGVRGGDPGPGPGRQRRSE